MKTIDESGTMLTTEPDLEAGYLVEDVEVVHHDAVEGTAPQWHRETAKLPDGSLAIYYRDGKEIGRDMVKIIDVPGVDPQPAWDEEVPVMRYIRYTAEELAAQAEAKKKAEEAAAQLEAWGLYAMVYTYTNFADTALDMEALAAYDLWIADYRGKRPARRHGMWQYTSSGKIHGVSGPVDLSHAYKDYATIIQRAGLTKVRGA